VVDQLVMGEKLEDNLEVVVVLSAKEGSPDD
jgi:hypothetical protein